MTVKVHLKTEEKKRAAAENATPVVAEPLETPAPAASAEPQAEATPTQDDYVQVDFAAPGEASAVSGATDPIAQVEEVGYSSKYKHYDVATN